VNIWEEHAANFQTETAQCHVPRRYDPNVHDYEDLRSHKELLLTLTTKTVCLLGVRPIFGCFSRVFKEVSHLQLALLCMPMRTSYSVLPTQKLCFCYELAVVLDGDFSALLCESSEWYVRICFVL
jgi:hypothetical protein